MKKEHPLKGKKKSAATIAKMKDTWAKKRAAKANGHIHSVLVHDNARDSAVYLRHALEKWPKEKKRGIARLYVELALATLEGKS